MLSPITRFRRIAEMKLYAAALAGLDDGYRISNAIEYAAARRLTERGLIFWDISDPFVIYGVPSHADIRDDLALALINRLSEYGAPAVATDSYTSGLVPAPGRTVVHTWTMLVPLSDPSQDVQDIEDEEDEEDEDTPDLSEAEIQRFAAELAAMPTYQRPDAEQ